MTNRLPPHLRGVRARITILAMGVTAAGVLLAGWWLLRSVDRSVTGGLRIPNRQGFVEVVIDGRAIVEHSVSGVRRSLYVAFPVLVSAAGATAWLLAGRALRPVEAIRTEVEEITASTLDRRVPVPQTGDEVARLATTMNLMLDRLEDASNRQQRFVADASHELRSPVTAMRTELEVALLAAHAQDWPSIAERLLSEEARLEAVIVDLLLLASLDEPGVGPDAVLIDLSELAREEARRRVPTGRGVGVEVDAPVPVLVRGSRTQLRRALANMLDNADHHARTTVRLAVHEREGRACLVIDDDGPGISGADRERVFERFTRLDDHRSRNGSRSGSGGGSGLGLSLVRGIVRRHGGDARVDTAPLGGARLVLDLPAAGARATPDHTSVSIPTTSRR
ncbi:MAG: ATP-binding protein [Acidimicrobiales bacterium]